MVQDTVQPPRRVGQGLLFLQASREGENIWREASARAGQPEGGATRSAHGLHLPLLEPLLLPHRLRGGPKRMPECLQVRIPRACESCSMITKHLVNGVENRSLTGAVERAYTGVNMTEVSEQFPPYIA